MKTFARPLLALFALLALLLAPAALLAQELPVATPIPVPPEIAAQLAEPWIAAQAKAHPVLLSVIAVIGALRVVFKPLVSAAHYFAARTPDPADDQKLASVERSGWFRAVAWLLDFGASIKVQRPPTVPPGTALCFLCGLLFLAPGCTSFVVEQGDASPERTITFKLRGRAWFSGSQAIANLKAMQTDKSQSFGTDSINNRGPTNAVAVIEAATKLVEAAKP